MSQNNDDSFKIETGVRKEVDREEDEKAKITGIKKRKKKSLRSGEKSTDQKKIPQHPGSKNGQSQINQKFKSKNLIGDKESRFYQSMRSGKLIFIKSEKGNEQ